MMRQAFLINFCLWLGLLLVFTTMQLPGDNFFWRSLQNAGHGLAMCFAAFLGIVTLRSKASTYPLIIPIVICIALLVLSVAIEVIQHLIGRGASNKDILMDATGIVAGVSFGTLLTNKRKFFLNPVLLVIAISLFAYIIRLPVFFFTASRVAPDLPVITNFDQFLPNAYLQASRADFSIADHRYFWPSSTKNSLLAAYSPAKWPYIRIAETATNWSEYNYLALDVFNAEAFDIRLNIRVDYKSLEANVRSFMVARRVIPPGYKNIDIPFSELVIEHYGGEPDLEKIDSVMMYLASPEKTVILYFDNVLLH